MRVPVIHSKITDKKPEKAEVVFMGKTAAVSAGATKKELQKVSFNGDSTAEVCLKIIRLR